jgi:hypothetical protein
MFMYQKKRGSFPVVISPLCPVREGLRLDVRLVKACSTCYVVRATEENLACVRATSNSVHRMKIEHVYI